MSFKDLVKKNRSYRGFQENRKITKEELLELADCARLCPSSVNVQPFCYYLAWEPDEVAEIQKLTKWARALPDLQLPHPGMYPTAFIVILQDMEIADSLSRYQKDVGITAQTILLAATEMGLGGCMIGNYNAGEVKRVLKLEKRYMPMLVIALGEPAEQVVLTEAGPGDSTAYYRDEADVHYVPKRKLQDIILFSGK